MLLYSGEHKLPIVLGGSHTSGPREQQSLRSALRISRLVKYGLLTCAVRPVTIKRACSKTVLGEAVATPVAFRLPIGPVAVVCRHFGCRQETTARMPRQGRLKLLRNSAFESKKP